MSGRYTYYWNAFLLINIVVFFLNKSKEYQEALLTKAIVIMIYVLCIHNLIISNNLF